MQAKESLVHLSQHLVLAVLVGLVSWWLTKSVWWGLVGGVVNLAIDFDHLFEYLWWSKGRFILTDFLTGAHFGQKKKMYVLLHSWELVLVLLLMTILTDNFNWLIPAWAMGAHLLFDVICWSPHPLAYFLWYRWRAKFAMDEFSSKD